MGSTLTLLIAMIFGILALHHSLRFHPDEAFYMTIARNAAIKGDWMLVSEPLDKPPLTYYGNALSLVVLAVDEDADGVLFLDVYRGEFAGRISTLLMSLILVAVVIALAQSLYADTHSALMVGLLVALSPLRIVFAPTVFTDMPMLLFATLSLWMSIKGKWGWSGIWFMLALAAKPQSIFYLPLLLVFGWRSRWRNHSQFAGLIWFIIPVAVGAALLVLWDGMRVSLGAASFWMLGQSHYPTTTLTAPAEWLGRAAELWQTVQYLFGHGILTVVLLIGGILSAHRQAFNRVLLMWLAVFLVLHGIITLNLFDRNLLLIVPAASILVAAALSSWHGWIAVLAMACFAMVAATGAYPIGGDDGRNAGIDQLAQYLNSKPVATVIYDPWLDWELDYYMGEWTNKRRVYYPTPQLLVAGALQLHETGIRYFVAPSGQDVTNWITVLSAAGFAVTLDRELPNFRVYSILSHQTD